jgi:hypothetical protein
MRITFTGRRLALAAVLVLGGVAAPLAYATITSPAKAGSIAAAPPTVIASPTSRQAPTAVADNPIQLVVSQSVVSGGGCWTFGGLVDGTIWVLDAVTVVTSSGAMSSVTVSPIIKTGPSTNLQDFTGISIPLDGDGDGSQRFSLLLKANTLANAAVGDAYGLLVCWNNPNPTANVTYSLIITGQRAAGSPTPVALADFTARSGKAGTTLRWTTASETAILGFNVWRYRGTKGVKVNRTLVRAKRSGKPAGAAYSFVDNVRGAKRGLSYRLQLVDLKGKRTWYAAFAIASK